MPRLAWCGLAYGCIGLGAIGLAMPLLPTTPFLLVAAWAAPRGSTRLARWLRHHPRLAPVLQAWRQERAVPRRAKALAMAMLLLSWIMLWLGEAPGWAVGATGLLFVSVAAFLLTRPDAAAPREDDSPAIDGRIVRS